MKKRNFTRLFLIVVFFLGIQSVAQAQSADPPETLPAAPTHDANDVFSLYSGVYTSSSLVTFSNVTTTTVVDEITISGDDILHTMIGTGGTPSVAYGAASFTFSTAVDLDVYNTFFFDFYAVEQNSFNLRVRFYQDASTYQEVTVRIATGWNKLEVDLNDLRMKGADLTEVVEIRLIGEGARTVYIDNVYACKANHSIFANAPTTPAPTPTQKASDVLPIFTDVYANEIGGSFPTVGSGETKLIKGIRYSAEEALDRIIYAATTKGGSNPFTFSQTIDISEYDSIHFDVFPIGSTIPMRITLDGSSKSSFNIASASTADVWNSIDISLEYFMDNLAPTANPDLSSLNTFWFYQSGGGSRTFFLDNIFFYKTRNNNGPGTGLNTASVSDLVKAYPSGDNILLESTVVMNSIQVYSLSGRHVKIINQIGTKINVDLQNETDGIFLFKIMLEDGSAVTKKILKM
ncbi:MAG: T9SS type A sorting domain-containing protein [Paludibacteraceae bacterium]